MLEEKKEWLKEKAEKGTEWIKEHKIYFGIAVGSITTIALSAIGKKIMEPQEGSMMIQTGYNESLDKDNFIIRVAGKNRFGFESYHSPWVRYEYGEEDKERINKAITAAINGDEPCEF